jgi:hypothetical protein
MILSLLALAACGPSRESFPDDYADAYCDFVLGCPDLADNVESRDACVDEIAPWVDGMLAERPERWDAALAQECLTALDGATGTCDSPASSTACLSATAQQ